MENKFFISICIPSYNRPSGLKRLLESIDSKRHVNEIQIVICEDNAPKRPEVKSVVDEYKKNSPFQVKYIENQINLGHGANWRQCSNQADGEFLLYMGDDDDFIPGALDPFIDWIDKNSELGYILRAYRSKDSKGKLEYHNYYGKDMFFEPGEEAYKEFFFKSVFMSGYTIRRDCTTEYTESCLDSTLFFQLYLAAEVCLKYPSAYCNIPISQFIGDGVSFFGINEKEKSLFTPGKRIDFLYQNIDNYFKVSRYIDEKYNLESTESLKIEWSKYSSYPTMLKQRQFGIKQLKNSSRELRSLELDRSKYFNLYYIGLFIFGAKFCSILVTSIKKVYGRRLHL